MAGRLRRRSSTASATTPTAMLSRLQSCGRERICRRMESGSPDCAFIPKRLGNCFMVIRMARPKAKPRSTGREITLDRAPSRVAAASRNSRPTRATVMATSSIFCAGVTESVASIAARIAAEEDVGETTAKRLWPKMA